MEQKEEFILLWKTGEYTFTGLAKMFNISRTTAHKYIERYENYGLPGLLELGIKPVYSDSGHPEQNRRHERMHIELKGEATRPPGKNLQAQQRKLNKFIYEYN